MLNWVDIVLVVIVLISAFVGYKRGFINTLFRLISFLLAVILALLFYKPLATYLTEHTTIASWMQEKIEGNYEEEIPKENEVSPNEINASEPKEETTFRLDNLPESMKNFIGLEDIANQTKEVIANNLSAAVINIISILIIFLVSRIVLGIIAFLLNGIAMLPILKQLNELLGLGVGIVVGFLQIYVIFAIITFLASFTNIDMIILSIKSSLFAKLLYENNLIINFLFH